jgi:peptidoglycan/LPS O-acetylase OafA/YrhL
MIITGSHSSDWASVQADPARTPPGASWTLGDGRELNVAAHGLRGLASLMVLGAHIIGGTARHIYNDSESYVEAVRAPWYLGTFGVNLFFIISGYVILPSALKYGPRDFALRRFLRLYPLFFVSSVFFIVMNAATNAYPKVNNFESVISALLFVNLFTGTEQLTPNAWSLTFEVIFYALMYGILYFVVRHRSTLPAVVAIVAGLCFLIAYPITIYFVAGAVIRLAYKESQLPLAASRALEIVCLVLTIYFASRGHFEYRWADFANPVVIPIILSTCAYFYFAVRPMSITTVLMDNRSARYIGTISYSLYLVHPYIYFSARAAFVKLGLFTADIGVSMALFAALVIGCSIPTSHIVNRVLERWPYQRFFRQGIYGEVPASEKTGIIVAGQQPV